MCILQKDVEKTNSSGYVDEKEIVRLVRRDERDMCVQEDQILCRCR